MKLIRGNYQLELREHEDVLEIIKERNFLKNDKEKIKAGDFYIQKMVLIIMLV